MAVLSGSERTAILRKIAAAISIRRDVAAVSRADLAAAVAAADDWADANEVSYNSALPLPARTALTAKQKAELLMIVIARRWEVI